MLTIFLPKKSYRVYLAYDRYHHHHCGRIPHPDSLSRGAGGLLLRSDPAAPSAARHLEDEDLPYRGRLRVLLLHQRRSQWYVAEGEQDVEGGQLNGCPLLKYIL